MNKLTPKTRKLLIDIMKSNMNITGLEEDLIYDTLKNGIYGDGAKGWLNNIRKNWIDYTKSRKQIYKKILERK